MATGHRMEEEKKEKIHFHRIIQSLDPLWKIVYPDWTPLKKCVCVCIKKNYLRYVKIHLKNCMLDDTWHKNKDEYVNWYSGMACRRLRGKVMKSCKQIWNCSYYREVVPTRKALFSSLPPPPPVIQTWREFLPHLLCAQLRNRIFKFHKFHSRSIYFIFLRRDSE